MFSFITTGSNPLSSKEASAVPFWYPPILVAEIVLTLEVIVDSEGVNTWTLGWINSNCKFFVDLTLIPPARFVSLKNSSGNPLTLPVLSVSIVVTPSVLPDLSIFR